MPGSSTCMVNRPCASVSTIGSGCWFERVPGPSPVQKPTRVPSTGSPLVVSTHPESVSPAATVEVRIGNGVRLLRGPGPGTATAWPGREVGPGSMGGSRADQSHAMMKAKSRATMAI